MKTFKLLGTIVCTSLMSLSSLAQTRNWVGGEIISNRNFRYGRIEFSMQGVSRTGALANFFTFRNGGEGDSVAWEEIDVEIFGENNANCYQTNIIYQPEGQPSSSRRDNNDRAECGRNFSTRLTRFRIDWRPGNVRIFDDRQTGAQQTYSGTAADEMNNSQSLRFNIWANNISGFAGTFNQCDLRSHTMVVDKITHKALRTGRTGNTFFSSTAGFNEQFSGSTLSSSRWTIANFTFPGNLARFSNQNVSVSGGRLRMRLSPGRTTSNGDSTIQTIRCVNGQIRTAKELTEISEGINIYPNPVVSTFTIDMNLEGSKEVVITNLSGATIYQTTTNDDVLELSKNSLNLTSGVYIVTISNTDIGTITDKLIVQ